MSSELAFIKLQLWIVIGMLLLFMISNILCLIIDRNDKRQQRFGEMLDRGELDKLIEKSESRLRSHPHDVGALYYGARAMMAKARYEEARANLERITLIQPTLREACQKEIAEIDSVIDGS